MQPFWIWLIGAVVWWIDAAIAVHYGNLPHALLAIVVAMLFIVTAVSTRSTVRKDR